MLVVEIGHGTEDVFEEVVCRCQVDLAWVRKADRASDRRRVLFCVLMEF